MRPVNPNASPQAIELLQFIHSISGKQTLIGQHSPPLMGSTRLAGAFKHLDHYPALFGQDCGFAAPGDWDGINFRQRIVDEAILRHAEGFIITLMWHAVRPFEDEPVDFLASVSGKITDEQWNELITPGTHLHERWKSQVDVIAWHLRQLQYADVPVLWRPYHEMNGGWFWWGKKTGENGYKKLYRMLFDRLVNFHKLNNLIWVYNCNEMRDGVDPYATCYPGDDVVDILATDVYKNNFAQSDYDTLLQLANGKPIALGEVGVPPSPAILKSQPKWAWLMLWGEPNPHLPQLALLKEIYQSEQTLTLEKLPWVRIKQPKIHYPIIK